MHFNQKQVTARQSLVLCIISCLTEVRKHCYSPLFSAETQAQAGPKINNPVTSKNKGIFAFSKIPTQKNSVCLTLCVYLPLFTLLSVPPLLLLIACTISQLVLIKFFRVTLVSCGPTLCFLQVYGRPWFHQPHAHPAQNFFLGLRISLCPPSSSLLAVLLCTVIVLIK